MSRKIFLVLFLAVFVLPVAGQAVPGFMLARMGTMEGQVFVDGKPAKEVLLTFFMVGKGLPPISNGGMGRIPDMVGRADADGKFQLQLLEGSYYMGILFRSMDDRPGPPRKGEKFYFADDGQGKLRQLPIADFKKSEQGRIDCSLPSVFKEVEDHFTVEGVVLRGADANEPLENALVLAKKSATAMRPEYFSQPTAKDGKFSINLPPGETFYLLARASITGSKPNPGEDIGKLGVDQDIAQENEVNFSGAPTPPKEEFLKAVGLRGQVNDKAIPVTGKKGDVISGMKIHMFKMPDSQAIKEARQNAAGVAGQGMGPDAGGATTGIEFAEEGATLSPDAVAELDGWVKLLQEQKEAKIEIGGYAVVPQGASEAKSNEVGDKGKKLSEERATAVKAYLQAKGIDVTRMRVTTYDAKEESTGMNPAGKGRVEIKILKAK